uniref:Semaphorin-7A n=1 Tax=Oreochromis niloticus TaxID=8128 RepID=A0A669CGH6_ORENI
MSLAAYLLFLLLCSRIEANFASSPRMIFTEKEKAMTRFSLPHDPPVQILLEDQSDTVLAAGQSYLNTYNFQNHKTSHKFMRWERCNSISSEHDCSYNITLVHQKKDANQLFVCGTDGNERVCCNTDLTMEAPMCLSSENIAKLIEGIERFNIKEGEPSIFIDSEQSAALYITHSGYDESVGIHKFGKARVRPKNHHKEQHYVGLVLSKREEDPSQSRVYGFYREKNKDTGLFSEMWIPFVTQVCMTDVGGPKNNLQFTWTSQMNARLFCGDPERKQHFSELVDVSTVDADRWQDTKIYALFRNEWGMSAVCIYTIGDIEKIFTNSPFKGYTKDQMDRPRMCVDDSTKLPVETLKKTEKTSEMEQLVHPVGNSGLLLFNHQTYTHIHVDGSPNKGSSHHTVIFLSLNNGGIHKVLHNKNDTFLIAEFRPFNYTEQISFILHPSSKKLYVNSGSQLVQLDVANCSQYGETCQDCMLSRDPYCGWDGTKCIRETKGSWHDAATGDLSICNGHNALNYTQRVSIPHHSKYFLQCPVSSRHAQYSWQHDENSTSCSSGKEQCLYLIDNMDSECKGTYKCISQEMGYSKVLVQYELQVENNAKIQQYKQQWPNKAEGQKSSPMIWVCLMMVLIKSLSF